MNLGRFWRATGLIATANAIALVLQFLTTVLMAREFGVSVRMDAYTLAVSIPEALQVLLMLASLSMIFTPLFIDARAQHGESEAWSMSLSLLVIVVGFCLLLMPLLVWLMPEVMYLFAPGFSPTTRALAVELSNLILPGVIYYATVGLLLGICYAYHDFVTPAVNTLLLALLNLAAFFVFVQFLRWGVQGMMLGRLLALVLLEAFLIWRVRQHKRDVPARVRLTNPQTWHLLTYLPPYLFGAVAAQVELFIVRSLVSTLGPGNVAAWGYGQRLADIPMALFGAAVGATYLPHFAAQVADKNYTAASEQWSRTVIRILLFLTPIAALLIALGAPLIALLFQRGAFQELATQQSAAVLAGLMLGLPLRGVGGLLSRGMPAFQTRALPLLLSAISTGATVLGAFAFVGALGLFGVALAASVGDSLFSLTGTAVFWRWLHTRAWVEEVVEGGKIVLASVLAGVSSYFTANLITYSVGAYDLLTRLLPVGVAGGIGLGVFLAVIFLLRVRETRGVFTLLRERAQNVRAGAR